MQEASSTPGVRAVRPLPALERAADPMTMAPLLAAVLGDHGVPSIQILRHIPGKRCVFAYRWADGTRVIGKMYRKDRARRHADALATLGRALDGTTRVPRLLACWEELGLLLQEWVPGEPLPEYFAWTEGEAGRMGVALADLHAAPHATAPESDLAAHERRTCHPGLDALQAALPELASDIAAIRAALAAAPPPKRAVTSHGDFGPRAAFAAGSQTWLVDLDGLCRTDPAFDVASVRVGLDVHRGDGGQALGALFLRAYRARSGFDLPALAAHEAFCDLRRAVILWRKQPAGWYDALVRCVVRGRARF
jgi:hypothetical protein